MFALANKIVSELLYGNTSKIRYRKRSRLTRFVGGFVGHRVGKKGGDVLGDLVGPFVGAPVTGAEVVTQ